MLDAPGFPDWLPAAVAAGVGFALCVVLRGKEGVATAVALTALTLAAGSELVGAGDARLPLQAVALATILGARSMVLPVAGQRVGWAAAVVAPIVAVLAALGAVAAWPGSRAAMGLAGTQACAVAIALLAALCLDPSPVAPPSARRPLSLRGMGLLLALAAWVSFALPVSPPRGGFLAGHLAFALGTTALWACATSRPIVVACLLLATALASACVVGDPKPWLRENLRVLAENRSAVAAYDRANQEMLLFASGELVDVSGPTHVVAELTTAVLRQFVRPGDRTLVLGQGSGRLPPMLLRAGLHEVEVVEARRDARPLGPILCGEGPVPLPRAEGQPPALPGLRVRTADWRSSLARLPDAGRQVVVVAELPSSSAPLQLAVEMQAEFRRVVGNGLVLQPLALDRIPSTTLRTLLRAAAAAHPWNAVFAVGETALLLSAWEAPSWPAPDAMSHWTPDARWIAHAAHLGDVADVQRALLGVVDARVALAGGEETNNAESGEVGGRRAALGVLRDLLRASSCDPPTSADSVLMRWLGREAELRAAVAEIRALPAAPAAAARAQAIAARFLHVGAPAPCLQAALGLPGEDGHVLTEPAAASLRAHAIDPTFFASVPDVLAGLPRPQQVTGDLEDLARLPDAAKLAELCTGESPLATALRVRFGSRCARALVEALAAGPLSRSQAAALRELADPFVLAEAGRVLRERAGLRELLALWRGDLPMPLVLSELAGGSASDRQLLAASLAGRRDAASLLVMADFMTAPELEIRRAAGAALQTAVGSRVSYDPEWPRSALIEAADRVRAMHNRAP